MIKGEIVTFKRDAKILGVVIDSELRYAEHMAKAVSKDLKAVICLRMLKMISPRTTRQPFVATIAPTMHYGSSAWSLVCGARE